MKQVALRAFVSSCLILFCAAATMADPPTLKPQFPLPDASRPLGIWHLSDPSFVTKDNPGGWNLDAGGAPCSNQWQDNYIARALPLLRRMGAQGVEIWDIEGSSLGLPAQYVGQPEIAQQLNPTFDYKRFFGKIRAQHLTAGIAIRANQKIIDGKPVEIPWIEQYETIRQRVAFARKEWKVKWVYVDSNTREALPAGIANAWVDGWLTPSTMWARLHMEFPDIIFIPEHKDAATHLWSMPYRALNVGESCTPAYIRNDIPRAISFINCSAVSLDDLRAALPALRASIAAGDILAIDAWQDSPQNALLAEAYRGN
jgi:hypothetical protein